jgi:hypothetical protein
MSSDELKHHVRLKELHTCWYRAKVRPCEGCSHVCTFCRQHLQLPDTDFLDLQDYGKEDILALSDFVKWKGLRFSVDEFVRGMDEM